MNQNNELYDKTLLENSQYSEELAIPANTFCNMWFSYRTFTKIAKDWSISLDPFDYGKIDEDKTKTLQWFTSWLEEKRKKVIKM